MPLTLIVPCFNEAPRLEGSIADLIATGIAEKTIIVDDGSTDNLQFVVQKHFPKANLLRLRHNVGKAQAVLAALQLVTTSHVLLWDADYRILDTKQLKDSCRKAKAAHERFDMIIFRQVADPLPFKVAGMDIMATGARIVRTSVLKQIFKELQPKGYNLEQKINQYVFLHKLKTGWVPLSTVNKLKYAKWPLATTITKLAHTDPFFLKMFFQFLLHKSYYSKQITF